MPSIYPKTYFAESKIAIEKGSCFVLMPFKKKFDGVYKAIKNVLDEELNIECKRADDFRKPHIIETILKAINTSEYVIADLTEANPNVFYELGLTHCLKEIDRVIILAQKIKFVPFDLQQFRCIVYEQSKTGLKKLKAELKKTFDEASKNSFRIKLAENKPVLFKEKLSGTGNFLYELSFVSPGIGLDGIKLQINFTQYSANKEPTILAAQELYLGAVSQFNKINNIPWTVTLLNISKGNAIISIERDRGEFVGTVESSPKFNKVEIEASFGGGNPAWKKFLSENINPDVPVKNGAQRGTYVAIVRFIIESNGELSQIKPITSHGFGMEEEVVRVIKKSPKWKPAFQNGHFVKAYRKQPITFIVE